MSDTCSLREAGAERRLAEALGDGVAFLRHRIEGLEHRESSDWDLAVRDPDAAGWAAERLLGQPLLRVERQYVIQRYFEWGQLDFLPVFEWQGFEYLAPDRFWSRVRVAADGLPRPCIAHDAFIAWMTGLLWGGIHRRRYEGLLARALAEQADEFRAGLEDAFGGRLAERMLDRVRRCDYAGIDAGALRRQLVLRRLSVDPASTLRRVASHLGLEFDHHRHPRFPWIAFLGPDGSGKSTILEALRERLGPTRIGVMESRWWPEPLRPGEVPGPPVTDPHAKPPRGLVLSWLKTLWLGLRWWKERLGRTGHVRAKKALLLSDRHYHDLLVDPRRYRYGASRSFASGLFRLLPRPDLIFVLVADPATIRARKAEVGEEELERQVAAYRSLCQELGPRAVEVDVTASPDEVAERVWHELTARLRGGEPVSQ